MKLLLVFFIVFPPVSLISYSLCKISATLCRLCRLMQVSSNIELRSILCGVPTSDRFWDAPNRTCVAVGGNIEQNECKMAMMELP